jgi:hypothetical protein
LATFDQGRAGNGAPFALRGWQQLSEVYLN